MAFFQVSLDLADALRPPTICWRCGADDLTITATSDRTSWYCTTCASRWDDSMGAVSLIEPAPPSEPPAPLHLRRAVVDGDSCG